VPKTSNTVKSVREHFSGRGSLSRTIVPPEEVVKVEEEDAVREDPDAAIAVGGKTEALDEA